MVREKKDSIFINNVWEGKSLDIRCFIRLVIICSKYYDVINRRNVERLIRV